MSKPSRNRSVAAKTVSKMLQKSPKWVGRHRGGEEMVIQNRSHFLRFFEYFFTFSFIFGPPPRLLRADLYELWSCFGTFLALTDRFLDGLDIIEPIWNKFEKSHFFDFLEIFWSRKITTVSFGIVNNWLWPNLHFWDFGNFGASASVLLRSGPLLSTLE